MRPGTLTAWLAENRDSLHGLSFREIHERCPVKVKLSSVIHLATRAGVRVRKMRPGPGKKA